ncbi:MAG: AAA family ATPase, partial [Thermoleophilia bacterium]
SLTDHKRMAARFYGLKSQLDNLGHRRIAVEERGEMLTQAAGRADGRIGYLKGQIERAATELKLAHDDHRDQQARLLELEAELSAHQEKLAGLEQEIGRRQRASEEKTRQVGELKALRDRYSHQLEYLNQRMQKIEASLERDRAKAEAGVAELEQTREHCRGEEAAMVECRTDNGAAEAAFRLLENRCAAVERQRQEVRSGLRRVAEDLQIAKARLTFISDSDRDRSGFPPAAKKVSEDFGVRALVDLIDVEPGYEKAVSAVLGSALFALAARDIRAAEEMLAAAREARLGSVEFMLAGPAGAAGANAAGDRLLDHVTIPPEAAYIIPLLQGVRFFEELVDAEGQSAGSWVTRDGVVYNADRRLLSYKADPPSSVVLKQRNERRHLEQERDEADSLRQELESKLARLSSDLEQLDGERNRAEQRHRDAAGRLREAENRLTGAERRSSVLEQELELMKTSQAHLATEKESLQAEQQEAGRRLQEAETALAEAQPRGAGDIEVDDETLAAQRHALVQQVTDLQIAAARARERERVSAATIERTGPALERLRRDRDIAAMQLAAYTAYSPACERLLTVVNGLMEAHGRVAARLEAELKEAEELSNLQSGSLRQLSQAETGLQQELSRASDMTTSREVNVTRLRDHFEDLEARLKAITERNPGAGIEELEAATEDELEEVESHVERLMRRRELIGPVNPLAQQEYEEMLERQQFLEEQRSDLEKSLKELNSLIRELTSKIEVAFTTTFDKVQGYFREVVTTLFPGGEGRLTMTEDGADDDDEESVEAEEAAVAGTTRDRRGIEISVKPARKAVRSLSLLSGGERSLVAIAFLFSIFLARPAPFYILDEVEAALDDQNITRLLGMLRRYQDQTQFIVITHQKRTMEVADVLYGVSMGEDGTSKVLSRRMAEGASGPDGDTREEEDREPAAIAG